MQELPVTPVHAISLTAHYTEGLPDGDWKTHTLLGATGVCTCGITISGRDTNEVKRLIADHREANR
jgi:phage terminase large subunit-like protein